MDIKQVIVYRRDLGMRKGKIAAQVAHASMAVFFDRKIMDVQALLQQTLYPDLDEPAPAHILAIPLTEDMGVWVEGLFAKIVLSVADEADLLRVHELAKAAGIPCALITDAGKTEFHGVPTRTTVALGPAKTEDIDKITGPEGQVQTKLA